MAGSMISPDITSKNMIDELESKLSKEKLMEPGDKLGMTLITKNGEYYEIECIGPIAIQQYAMLTSDPRTKNFTMYPYQVPDRRICFRLSEVMGATMHVVTDTFRGLKAQLASLKEMVEHGKKIKKDFLQIEPVPRGTKGTYHTDLQELASSLGIAPDQLPEKAQSMAAEYNQLVRQEFLKQKKQVDDVIKPLPKDYYEAKAAKFRSTYGFGRIWHERGIFTDDAAIDIPPAKQAGSPAAPDAGMRRSMIYPGWDPERWCYIDALFIKPDFLEAQIRTGIDLARVHSDVNEMFEKMIVEFTRSGDPASAVTLYKQTNRSVNHPRSDMGAKKTALDALSKEGYAHPERIPVLYMEEISRMDKKGQELMKSLGKR